MCGRYYIDEKTLSEVWEDFPELDSSLVVPPSGDIVPSMPALSITAGADSGLTPAILFWGFPGFDGKKLIINARAESIRERPTFADSIRERRCVLPAAGFYEWDRKKQKVAFVHEHDPVIYLAGIWKPYGDINRFVIITREANESMIPVHDRMPLMIEPGDVKDWLLDPAGTENYLTQTLPQLSAKRDYEQLSLF